MEKNRTTKRAISQAMLKLSENSVFDKISVRKIAQEVGINRQTFYYHFSDKKELLKWFYHQDSLHFLEADTLTLENWEEETLKMLKAMQQKAGFYHNSVAANQEILMSEFSKITQRLFIHLFETMDTEKELSNEDKQFYARFFSYGCSGVLAQWILDGCQENPLVISAQLFQLAKDTEFFSYRLYKQEQTSEEW